MSAFDESDLDPDFFRTLPLLPDHKPSSLLLKRILLMHLILKPPSPPPPPVLLLLRKGRVLRVNARKFLLEWFFFPAVLCYFFLP